MATRTHGKSLLIALLRGMLGGMVCGFVWVVVIVLLSIQQIGPQLIQGLVVAYALSGLPFGLLVGGTVGIVTWLIHTKKSINLDLLDRAFVGTTIGVIVRSIELAMQNNSGYLSGTWYSVIIDILFYGLVLGGVPGMIVGQQKTSRFSRVS